MKSFSRTSSTSFGTIGNDHQTHCNISEAQALFVYVGSLPEKALTTAVRACLDVQTRTLKSLTQAKTLWCKGTHSYNYSHWKSAYGVMATWGFLTLVKLRKFMYSKLLEEWKHLQYLQMAYLSVACWWTSYQLCYPHLMKPVTVTYGNVEMYFEELLDCHSESDLDVWTVCEQCGNCLNLCIHSKLFLNLYGVYWPFSSSTVA